jgi:hypothetical protein
LIQVELERFEIRFMAKLQAFDQVCSVKHCNPLASIVALSSRSSKENSQLDASKSRPESEYKPSRPKASHYNLRAVPFGSAG